jgi:hypothetical protein
MRLENNLTVTLGMHGHFACGIPYHAIEGTRGVCWLSLVRGWFVD